MSWSKSPISTFSGLMKNIHLLRYPYSSSLQRTSMYASFLRISGALHLGIFAQPLEIFSQQHLSLRAP
jgi:hypothetical protein